MLRKSEFAKFPYSCRNFLCFWIFGLKKIDHIELKLRSLNGGKEGIRISEG